MPRPDPTPSESQATQKPNRAEWALVLVVAVLGIGFRAAFPSRLAVEHFDEGVYASNIWFDKLDGFRYPARHLFAPPLVPWILESSQIVFGPTALGTMLPGILFGSLTVLVVWWIVRNWFGIAAGLAACCLAAFSDYHILYSRSALTEPVLCFLLPASVYLLWRALVDGDFRWALFAGLAGGLAWSSKYNGWLPIAIGIAGLSAWSIGREKPNPSRGRRFAALAVAGLAMLVVFYPVWSDLESRGGYRAVRENHARYLVGLSGWFSSASRHFANHRYFESPLSWIGLFVAVAGSRFVTSNDRTGGFRLCSLCWTISLALFAAALGMLCGTSTVLGVLGLIWLIVSCPWWRKSDDANTDLAYWLIAAWFAGLLLATPLYTPYPRLSLPWLISAWTLAAAFFGSPTSQRLLQGEYDWQQGTRGTFALILLAASSLAAIGIQFGSKTNLRTAAWEDRAGLARAADRVGELAKSEFGNRAVVYVYAEPALFYHLRANQIAAAPIANLPTRSLKKAQLFAVGPHARRSEPFQKEWQQAKMHLELLEEIPFAPSSLVLLNHYTPADLARPDFSREQTIQVYRFKTP